MSLANIFSHSAGCLLVLLIVSSAVQSFLSWWVSYSSSLLLFHLPSETCWVRSCCGWGQRSCYLLSPPRVLILSCLTFRSFIHFQFMFLYGIRKWSSFILLHVAVQFSQDHLQKRLSFFHWILFPALSKISWPYICWPTSGLSSIPLVYVPLWINTRVSFE